MNIEFESGQPPKYNVCIALPIYGGAEPNFLMALVGLCLTLASEGIAFALFPHSDSLITRARNTMVNDILWEMDEGLPGQDGKPVKRKYTHVLFLDCDLVFDPNSIVAMLKKDKDLIGGVYPVRGYDWEKIVAAAKEGKSPNESRLAGARYVLNYLPSDRRVEKNDDGSVTITTDVKVKDGTFEVLDVGTGLMLISVKCLRKLAPKCQKYLYDMPGPKYRREMRDFFGTYVDKDRRFLSEDYAFCARWREKCSGKVFAYLTQVNHVGKAVFEGNMAGLVKQLGGG
jgi:hypothetical protein